MCAGEYQTNEHQCGVAKYNKERGKFCIHDVIRSANYDGTYQANSIQCPARHKVEVLARNKKRIDINQEKLCPNAADNSDLNTNTRIDNEERKSAQNLE